MILRLILGALIILVGFTIAGFGWYYISSMQLAWSFLSEREKKERLDKLISGEWGEEE